MGRRAFPVLALGLAAGIWLSAVSAPGIPVLLLSATVPAAMLLYARRVGAGRPATTVLVFLFFVAAGNLRTCFPDISLLPQGFRSALDGWGHGAAARLDSLPLQPDTAALLKAMLLGQREGLPAGLRGLYARVGASHVLALSGLHLGVLFGGLYAVLLRSLSRGALRWAVGTVCLAGMWTYVFLTGASPSLVRAGIMTSLVVLGQTRQCGFSAWHTLGLAAFIILLATPSALWSVGFQLSFAAVAGILAWHRRLLCRPPGPGSSILPGLWQLAAVSIAAQLAVSPLLLHYFGHVSLSAFALGPLYVLLATLMLYLGVAALLGCTFAAPWLDLLAQAQHRLMLFAATLP